MKQHNVQFVCYEHAQSGHGASMYCSLAMYMVSTKLSPDSKNVAYMGSEIKYRLKKLGIMSMQGACMNHAWSMPVICADHV